MSANDNTGPVLTVSGVVNVNRTDPGRRTMDATAPKSNRFRTVPLTADTVALLAEMRPKDAKGTAWVWPALLRRGGETRARARSEKAAGTASSGLPARQGLPTSRGTPCGTRTQATS